MIRQGQHDKKYVEAGNMPLSLVVIYPNMTRQTSQIQRSADCHRVQDCPIAGVEALHVPRIIVVSK